MTLDDCLRKAFAGRGIHPVAHDALRKAMMASAPHAGSAVPGESYIHAMARQLRDQIRPEVWARYRAGVTIARICREMGRSYSLIGRIISEGPPG